MELANSYHVRKRFLITCSLALTSHSRKESSPCEGKPSITYASWKFLFKAVVEVKWDGPVGGFCFVTEREHNSENNTLFFYSPAVEAMSCPSIKAISKTSTSKDVARRCASGSCTSDCIYGPVHWYRDISIIQPRLRQYYYISKVCLN